MKTLKQLVLCLICIVMMTTMASAQPSGGSRPAPSGGGNAGGPGMSGQALNAGTMPEGGSFEAPQGDGVNVQAGNGESRQGGGGFEAPQGGGVNVQVGDGGSLPDGGTGGGPRVQVFGGAQPPVGDYDGDGQPDVGTFLPSGGMSQDVLNQFYTQLLGRGGGFEPTGGFGGRGLGNISLDALFASPEYGGGFGTRSQRTVEGESLTGTALEGTPWMPTELQGELPVAPAALTDLTAITQAQENAQVAVDVAVQQSTEAAQQAADAATQAAQQAYDQFWTDYYAAVDYTANAYYATVTASADYMLQTYEEAVNYTMQAVDYYIAYAEQYAYYCAAYPWDCYSYVYDATYNTYVYVGEVSDEAVSTTTVGEVTTTATYPIQPTPTPSAEAYEALVVFANDQLGAVVEPVYAGVATDEVQLMMGYLPAEIQAYLLNTTTMSGTTYWGLLHGGFGAVMVGDCAADSANCAVTADNLSVQLSSAAAGAYGILANQTMPTTTTDALALITMVYPKLDGLAFAQITDVEQGLAFMATTASMGYDTATMQPVSAAKVVYAGVVDVNGQAFVYAMVGVGEGYVSSMTNFA